MGNVLLHVHRVGISAHLLPGLCDGRCHLVVSGVRPEVFELYDVLVLHVAVYLVQRAEEDVCIPSLVVELRNGTVVAALACQGESVAMYERLSLLPVTLRGVCVYAVGYILEEGLEVTIVCHVFLKTAKAVSVCIKMVVSIVVKQIGVYTHFC